jgi:hypothetical protein
MANLDDIARDVSQMRHEVNIKLDRLNRGVYGDPDNHVKGLMQRQNEDEAWRAKIDERQDKTDKKLWKIGATMGAFVAGLDFAIMYVKGFFK